MNKCKQRIAFIALCAMFSSAAMPQTERWSVTLLGGPTMTTLVGDDVSDINSAMGWGAGIEGEYRLSAATTISTGTLFFKMISLG